MLLFFPSTDSEAATITSAGVVAAAINASNAAIAKQYIDQIQMAVIVQAHYSTHVWNFNS